MGELRIRLDAPSELAGVPVAVEVLDADLTPRWNGAIAIGGAHSVRELDAGKYAVLASLPSGRRLQHVYTLKEGSPVVDATLEVIEPSTPGALCWAELSKPGLLAKRPGAQQLLSDVWLRLWGRVSGAAWAVLPWPDRRPTRDESRALVQYRLPLRRGRSETEFYLQAGGERLHWRLIALPADDVHVVVNGVKGLPGESPERDADPVEVSIATANLHADVMLRHLRRGEMDQARMVSASIITDELLRGESPSLFATVVAGYYLLRAHDLEPLGRWLANVPSVVAALPDTPLIRAWYHLRLKKPEPDAARQLLVDAAQRGLPMYTRGVRLLLDGLQMFDEPSESPDPVLLGQVHAALRAVTPYAEALDWHAGLTTFFGAGPRTPWPNRSERRVGMPEDRSHVTLLTGPDEPDLAASSAPSGEPFSLPERGATALSAAMGPASLAAPNGLAPAGEGASGAVSVAPSVLPDVQIRVRPGEVLVTVGSGGPGAAAAPEAAMSLAPELVTPPAPDEDDPAAPAGDVRFGDALRELARGWKAANFGTGARVEEPVEPAALAPPEGVAMAPAAPAAPPSLPLDMARARAFLDACTRSAPRVTYGLGAKVPRHGATPGRDFTKVDCSGFVRELIWRASSPQRDFPDGSVVQHEWIQAKKFPRETPAAGTASDGVIRIAFLRPQDAASGIGHVVIIHNGRTLESHGGVGPNSRPWTAGGWQAKARVYTLARAAP